MRLPLLFFVYFGLLLSHSGFCEVIDTNSMPTSEAPSKKMESSFEEALQQELNEEGGGDSHFWKSFIYMLFVLSAIVSILLFLSWTMKKMVYTRLLQENATSMIKILDRRSLSPKSLVYVVEIEGKQLVLGESLNGITKLAEKNLASDFSIEDEETQDSLKKLSNQKKEIM